MKFKPATRYTRQPAFTLVELLVVIAIVAVLAVIGFYVSRSTTNKATAVKSLSNLRQSGSVLLADAQEKNNRLNLFSGGSTGGFDERAYNIVRSNLGMPQEKWNNQIQNRVDVMHWNPKKIPPANFHWECFAVNFTNAPKFGVSWMAKDGRPDGSNGRTLYLISVQRPESYPILLESSTAAGKEIFRVGISASELPGLRSSGRSQAFFLDGSARGMLPADLKKAGFTRTYDNSTTPPKLLTL